jgi:AcrR family transcriptional regulator
MRQKTRRAEPRPYHHGDLRTVLLREAEAILESGGMLGLTLRAISRQAGVSHAAPNNHFGDLTGLLSELAAVGFTRFGSMLSDAMAEAGEEPRARTKAMGLAYVGFARRHPGLFSLMFRSEILDASRPALREAIAETRNTLRAAAIARTAAKALTPLQLAAQATALWSLAHGFSVLMLDGRLDGTITALPGREDAAGLLEAVLTATHVGD